MFLIKNRAETNPDFYESESYQVIETKYLKRIPGTLEYHRDT